VTEDDAHKLLGRARAMALRVGCPERYLDDTAAHTMLLLLEDEARRGHYQPRAHWSLRRVVIDALRQIGPVDSLGRGRPGNPDRKCISDTPIVDRTTPEGIVSAIEQYVEMTTPLEGSGTDGWLIDVQRDGNVLSKGAAIIAAVRAGDMRSEAAYFVRWG
jgi:hypothetical protein